jgi:RNA polymerase sigma factor (sigma-70 family)
VPIVRPPLRLQMSHDAVPVTPVPMDDEDVEQQLSDAGFSERDVADEVAEQRDAPRLAELLRAQVAQLPERQRDIIVARFGLDGGDECTLQQLSSERGVTRERIRQLQVSALQTLREALESAGVTRDVALAT